MKKKLILNVLPLLLLFLVFSSATAVWAWKSINYDLTQEKFKMEIAGSNGVSIHEYHIYKWSGATEKGEEVSNNLVGDPLYDVAVSLTEYDTIFTDRNVDTPLIVKVIIREVPDSSRKIRITATCPAANYESSEHTLKPYFSNICSIKFVLGDEEMNALTDPDDIFQTATAANNENNISYSYVTVTDDEATTVAGTPKVNTLTMDVEDYSTNIQTLTFIEDGEEVEVEDCLVIYMQILYNPSLVDAYNLQNQLDVTQVDVSEIGMDLLDFPFDLSEMSFSYLD